MAITPRIETEVLLHDDFNGSAVNEDLWNYPIWTPVDNPSYYGQTQIRQSLPKVADGVLQLRLDTHNPTGNSFYGSEIISDQEFAIGTGIAFEARARLLSPLEGGLVGGIFAYEYENSSAHDEVTFELLSNDAVGGSNRVLTNAYNEQPLDAGDLEYVPVSSELTNYHDFRIEVVPGSVRWFLDGSLVREATDTVPDDPMRLHLNFWAAGAEWPDAYNPLLQPATDPATNQSFLFDVDYAHVARLGVEPTTGDDYLLV